MRTSSPRWLTLAAVLGALLLRASEARADDPATPPAENDTLDPLREQFRAGMASYQAGAFADATVIWVPIYNKLGREKGYRLAFNIAKAYEQLGLTHERAGLKTWTADASQAAEYFAAYVRETSRRREAGETLEPLIEKQEVEAKEHLGQIKIEGDVRGVEIKVDGDLLMSGAPYAWVTPAPATHVVTFRPGTPDEQRVSDVSVDAKKEIVLAVPAPASRHAVAPPPPPVVRWETATRHPYRATVLYVAAGITAVSFVVPAIFYANAGSIKDDYDRAPAGDQQRFQSDYTTAKETAYTSWVIPGVLGAATIGLAAYWLFGTKEVRVPVQGMVTPHGATLGAAASF